MEEQEGIALLAILGSMFVVFIVILFVVFIISQKRKQHSLKSIIEIMKASHSQNYEVLKEENEEIKKELAMLKQMISDQKK